MVRINIATLKEGKHHFQLTPSAEALELHPEEFEQIKIEVALDYRGEKIFVALEASAIATLECDRTLQLFQQPISGTYQLLFAPPGFVGKISEDWEEIRPFTPEEREIDLTDVVRDTLLLALPMRRIAPGAEDIEIPLQFGAPSEEEEIDPRWAALLKLKQENPKNL